MCVVAPTFTQKELKQGQRIVSKTDLQGRITYCNSVFMELSGYTERQLLGKAHSIVRHPDMPKIIFSLLWQRLKEGLEIVAYVKNLCKDGSYYWVLAFVTPSFDETGRVVGYHSMRLKPSQKALEIIEPLYKNLLQKEKEGGLQASKIELEKFLEKQGVSYDEFIFSL